MVELLNNRFEIGEQLGEGGMAIVYHGVDSGTKQKVAIKRLKREAVVKHPEQSTFHHPRGKSAIGIHTL